MVRGFRILLLLLAVVFVASSPTRAQKVYEPKAKEEVEKKESAEEKWLSVGEATLKPGKKEVKILIGWERGRVDTFKVQVEERAVEILEVEVHYAKGAKDVYELEEVIPAGDETGLFTFDRDSKRYLRKMYIRFRFPELDAGDRQSGDWKQPAQVEILGRRKTS